MVRVSIIIPTYNRARLVVEAIESILNQTYSSFELLVVDDGSTDNTEEVVHSFTDPRLRYLKQLNGGPSVARNAGIQVATGEFIAFLDSDDLFLPEKLSLQMAKVEDNPAVGLVYGLYLSNSGLEGSLKVAGGCYPQLELRQLLLGPAFHWSTVLIRRTLLEQVGRFDETLMRFEDWELTLRLALVGCRMICVTEPVSIVRNQPIGNTRDQHQYMSTSFEVLNKTFTDSRMPPDLINLRDRAQASQLLRMAASAFVTSHFDVGKELVRRALATCPSLMSQHMDFFVDLLVYRIRGLSLVDPEEVLQQVVLSLPGERAFLRKLTPKLWGRFYEIAAFQSYQLRQRAECIVNVIRAVSQTPSSLRNRGLLSIFVRSFLGNQINNEIKRGSITLQSDYRR